MRAWFKSALLGLGMLALVWAAVVLNWYWRAHEPSPTDVVLGLLVLPALLAGAYVVLKLVLASLLRPAAGIAPQAAAAEDGAAPAGAAAQPAGPPQRMWLGVLAGSVRMPAGGAAELLQACADGLRPALDDRLRDGEGFPVVAARVPALDGMDALEWWDGTGLDAAVADGRAWVARLPAARVRELRLLAEVLAESAAGLERLLGQAHAASAGDAARQPAPDAALAPWPRVQVALLWDAPWPQEDGAMLLAWAQAWLAQCAPALRFEVMQAGAQPLPAARPGLPWPDALLEIPPGTADGENPPAELWLLAGARSLVDQAEVDAMAASGRLYGPKRREGLIAGEGAAALALVRAHPQHPPAFVDASQAPVLAGMAVAPARQGKPGSLLGPLAAEVLAGCAQEPASIAKVSSDADHRPGLALEMGMLLSQHFPELALDGDCALLGQPCGHTGGAAALASLVLAAEQAATEQRGALALTLAGERWLGAALLMPPGWTRPAPPASA